MSAVGGSPRKESWWAPLLRRTPRATLQNGEIQIDLFGVTVTLAPMEARAFAMDLFRLVDHATRDGMSGAREWRPLVWRGEGCHLEGEPRPVVEGEFLCSFGPNGWLRGECTAASPVPLLSVTRGVLYLRPQANHAGEPTRFRRVSSG